tara:strand:- start:220 stop:465 length:246 start_codon:yes stop_codon:yes gene_type:complete
MESIIMYKRDKKYDGTILQGLVPAILSKTEKKKPKKNMHRRKTDADFEDNQICSKFAESSRYIVRESILRHALISERRTQN